MVAPLQAGVRGQALSLLRLPSSGGLPASATHVLWARKCGCGAQHCPLGLHALWGPRAAGVAAVSAPAPQCGALASRCCVLWGRRKGVPVCLLPLRGGSEFRRFPLPSFPPLGGLLGPATRMLWARVCECGGPALST